MGTARYVYNRGLYAINKEGHSGNFMELRNRYVTKNSIDKLSGVKRVNAEINDWELATPKDIRAESLRDLNKNLINNKKRIKDKKLSHFKLKYKLKREPSSIIINKRALTIKGSEIYLFKNILKEPVSSGKRTIKKWFSGGQLAKSWDYQTDVRLYYDNFNFFLNFPIYSEATNPRCHSSSDIISLDPGLRTFQTGYSEKEVIKCHVKDPKMIKRLRERIDNLRSLRSRDLLNKGRYRKRNYLISNKLKNMVDDLHWQTSNYLTKNYSKILLPYFESQEMKRISGVTQYVTKSRNRNFTKLQAL
jgi:hypothetical protein